MKLFILVLGLIFITAATNGGVAFGVLLCLLSMETEEKKK